MPKAARFPQPVGPKKKHPWAVKLSHSLTKTRRPIRLLFVLYVFVSFARLPWFLGITSSTINGVFFPNCANTTIKTAEKLFFNVPKDPTARNFWLRVSHRLDKPSEKSVLFCCEDHFDVNFINSNIQIFTLEMFIVVRTGHTGHRETIIELSSWGRTKPDCN